MALVDALAAASRHWTIEMHFQKGLAGAPAEVLAAARETPINPAATDAFMLAIVASEGPPAFPGMPGHEPDIAPRPGATLPVSPWPRPNCSGSPLMAVPTLPRAAISSRTGRRLSGSELPPSLGHEGMCRRSQL